jgi:arginyl-tRNA--protein-N-Asp/Glu arginylyltransferase
MRYLWNYQHSQVMHLSKYTATGDIAGTWCQRPWNRSCNLPLGRPTCKDCARLVAGQTVT